MKNTSKKNLKTAERFTVPPAEPVFDFFKKEAKFDFSSILKKLIRGTVVGLRDGIITIRGLMDLKSGEVVWVKTTSKTIPYIRALILNLATNSAQAILLGNERLVVEDAAVYRTKNLFTLECSLGLFGTVVGGVGEHKIKKTGKFVKEIARLVEQKATGIIDRKPVRIPLKTGVKAVDSLVPIGRGQRELIIGDRQTGKTSVALDIVINHIELNNKMRWQDGVKSTLTDLRNVVWFVYNAIGQKQSTVNGIFNTLVARGASWFTSIVAATSAESAPLQFLAPYTACTLGEFIRDVVGGHAVVIYDDLSKHAVAYRQMSLLLRRPPGREAFPGDVFYVHSRLLERAGALTNTHLKTRGTLTAFPVIETQAGDVSAYIPTNVISITDGQIFLETELFYKGVRPAVNVGLSVSRVGSAAQPFLLKRVAGGLKMELAQYREIEGFAKLGAALDEATQRTLSRGESLVELLKQGVHSPISTFNQSITLFLGLGYSGSWLNDIVAFAARLGKSAGLKLFSSRRIRGGWLEWLRNSAPDLNTSHISQITNEFLSWLSVSGISPLYETIHGEKMLGTCTLKENDSPLFFDQLFTAWLKERSLVSFNPFNEKPFKKISLFNLVLGPREFKTNRSLKVKDFKLSNTFFKSGFFLKTDLTSYITDNNKEITPFGVRLVSYCLALHDAPLIKGQSTRKFLGHLYTTYYSTENY